jgi:hypothetical protein
MPTAYELALERDWAKNRAGKQSAKRRFKVDTVSPAAALLADGIPGINTSHPDLETLRLDRYNVSVDSAGVCVVDCDYSNDSRFVDLRQPNKDAPRWYHWGWSMRKVMVDLPICVRSSIINAGVNGDVEKKVWKIAKKQVSETRVIRPLQVRVQITNVRAFDVIADQTDKIHIMPDGKEYHFEGATVTQVDDEGFYDISYTWEYDHGTTFFPDFSTADCRYCEPSTPGLELNRRPYTVFVAYQTGNPERDVPKFDVQDLYPYGNSQSGNLDDGQGWQLLPGTERII